jgi:mannose/cellobiose epimerase-like protein (N-acyl-D-glucosamine 2-epimerase family)
MIGMRRERVLAQAQAIVEFGVVCNRSWAQKVRRHVVAIAAAYMAYIGEPEGGWREVIEREVEALEGMLGERLAQNA